MVAFSIALAASVLFICAANVINNYLEHKQHIVNNSNNTYYGKLKSIDNLCNQITENAITAKEKNEYFSISNYENLVEKIKCLINL